MSKKIMSKRVKPIAVLGTIVVAGILALFGLGYLNIGSWHAPTNQMKVDSAGIHFYSGHTDVITWHLQDQTYKDIAALKTSGLGYYNFALPSTSGKYYLYCTGATGCDAGDWIMIDLTTVPPSPADAIITGYCGSTDNPYKCDKPSSYFVWRSAYGDPFRNQCNTCSPRDINDIPGYNNLAVITTAPPKPEPVQTDGTPEPTLTPVATTEIPIKTPEPTLTPVATTEIPAQTPESIEIPAGTYSPETGIQQQTSAAETPREITCQDGTYYDEYLGSCKPINKDNSALYIVGLVAIILVLAYFYFYGGKRK